MRPVDRSAKAGGGDHWNIATGGNTVVGKGAGSEDVVDEEGERGESRRKELAMRLKKRLG